ncbi:unnamed protein product [Prorocentrum cordatum]|uniref:Cellulase n=1 Tax=Prorocentrum cordatum TaxID=2364126 RepID=A0ABN9Y652_9DINO|nr:unnamed protein product [Polarella glacialis]
MEWCCEKEKIGCTTTTPKPYDCAAAEQNSKSAWSDSKTHWCCAHELRGCPPFNCSDTSSASSWSLAQSVYCCETANVGCTTTTTTTPPPYNCQEGLAQWMTEWPEDKKDGTGAALTRPGAARCSTATPRHRHRTSGRRSSRSGAARTSRSGARPPLPRPRPRLCSTA